MRKAQFFVHMYDVHHALEVAGVASFLLQGNKADMNLVGGAKRDINAFLDVDELHQVRAMAHRVYQEQRGLLDHSRKNEKYRLFKRPVVVSVVLDGKLLSSDFMVLAETGLKGVLARENQSQVRKMKEAIAKAHREIEAVRG